MILSFIFAQLYKYFSHERIYYYVNNLQTLSVNTLRNDFINYAHIITNFATESNFTSVNYFCKNEVIYLINN